MASRYAIIVIAVPMHQTRNPTVIIKLIIVIVPVILLKHKHVSAIKSNFTTNILVHRPDTIEFHFTPIDQKGIEPFHRLYKNQA